MINQCMSMELLTETSSTIIQSKCNDIRNLLTLTESVSGDKPNIIQKIKDLIKLILSKLKDLANRGLQIIITRTNNAADFKISNFVKTSTVKQIIEQKQHVNTTFLRRDRLKLIDNKPTVAYYITKLTGEILKEFDDMTSRNTYILESQVDDIYIKIIKAVCKRSSDKEILENIKNSILKEDERATYTEEVVSEMFEVMSDTHKVKQEIQDAYQRSQQDMTNCSETLTGIIAHLNSTDNDAVSTATAMANKYNAVMSKVTSLLVKISLQDLNIVQQVSVSYYGMLSHQPITSGDNRHM